MGHGKQERKGPRETGRSSNLLEHLVSLYGGEPKAVSVRIVIARPSAMALDEWGASKLFQTGPGGGKGLARTFSTSAGVLQDRTEGMSWRFHHPEPRDRFTVSRKEPESHLRRPTWPPGSSTLGPNNCSTPMMLHHPGLLARLGCSGLHTIPGTKRQLHPVGEGHPAFLESSNFLPSNKANECYFMGQVNGSGLPGGFKEQDVCAGCFLGAGKFLPMFLLGQDCAHIIFLGVMIKSNTLQ